MPEPGNILYFKEDLVEIRLHTTVIITLVCVMQHLSISIFFKSLQSSSSFCAVMRAAEVEVVINLFFRLEIVGDFKELCNTMQ